MTNILYFYVNAVVLANLSTVLDAVVAFGAQGNRPISSRVEASKNLSLSDCCKLAKQKEQPRERKEQVI